jgi:hypothetical protein
MLPSSSTSRRSSCKHHKITDDAVTLPVQTFDVTADAHSTPETLPRGLLVRAKGTVAHIEIMLAGVVRDIDAAAAEHARHRVQNRRWVLTAGAS